MLSSVPNHIKELIQVRVKAFLLMMILALGAIAIPASAQTSGGSSSFAYNDFSFSVASTVASNVVIAQVAGEPASTEQPGGPNVQHTQFTLYNGTDVPQDYFGGVGSIHVYNTADFAGYDLATQEYQKLQNLLAQHPDLTQYMVPSSDSTDFTLPYLPGVGAGQVIRARANYVDTATVSGVSYITAFKQDVSPFTGSEFLYTFQGLSKDGAHYIAAIFTLNTGLFPASIPSDFDYDTFGKTLNDYFAQSIATLNGGQPTDFTPSLADLDALVQSFSFAGGTVNPPAGGTTPTVVPPVVTVVPTVENSDPTLGGLANKTWTLVSYGDPANPTAVVPGTQPVTMQFTAAGVAGNGGCNGFGGSFQYSGNTLTFSQIIHTLIACDQPILDQENALFDALSTATTYQINGDQLQITYDGGVLTFTGA